jgi:hypothetical protein
MQRMLIASASATAGAQCFELHDMDPVDLAAASPIRAQDINFDGYNDIVLSARAGAANTYARYWIYQPATNQFADLGELPELMIDHTHRRLSTYERNGNAGMAFEARDYTFVGETLTLIRSDVQSSSAQPDVFLRVVSIRRGRNMQVIERRRIEARH